MKGFLFFFLLITNHLYAQKIYQSFEVETAAQPAGGLPLLNRFIEASQQIPLSVKVSGKAVSVFVKGIIETDGTMSGLEIVRSADSLCGREAIRVLGLFKSWKPALKEGQSVRQSITYTVQFKSEPLQNYDEKEHGLVQYFNKDWRPVTSPEFYRFKIVTPLDEFGNVNGDVTSYEKEGTKWTSLSDTKLMREKDQHADEDNGLPDTLQVTRVFMKNEKGQTQFMKLYKIDGTLLADYQNTSDGKPFLKRNYYANGSIRRSRVLVNGLVEEELIWNHKGQLLHILEFPMTELKTSDIIIREVWDDEGNHLVKDGNGEAEYCFEKYSDQLILEKGIVKNSLKSGTWTGKLPGGNLLFEEKYDQGKLIQGISFKETQQFEYTTALVKAEFEGGVNEMYKFLMRNVKYSSEASKRGVMGMVRISFVIREDGSLSDYKIDRSVAGSLDLEALRVIKLMDGKWKPGVNRGQKVRTNYNMPITFSLSGGY